jgi:hypothetical protein
MEINTKEMSMKKIQLFILTLFLTLLPYQGFAAALNLSGCLSNITSIPSGLYIMIDTGVPTSCTDAALPNWIVNTRSQ